MKPHESFRQRSVSKKGMVSNASIITLKLEEENVNPEVSKTFADRLKSLSSKEWLNSRQFTELRYIPIALC